MNRYPIPVNHRKMRTVLLFLHQKGLRWRQLWLYDSMQHVRHFYLRRKRKFFLASIWICGLYFGSFAASQNSALVSMMRTAAQSRVSIVSLLPVLLLPFLISAFAVSISKPWLIILVCFSKAFSFGLHVGAISIAFGSAGWLARMLLLFSAGCCVPVLYWFWLRHFSGRYRSAVWRDFGICSGIVLFIGFLDCGIISPYLASIIY